MLGLVAGTWAVGFLALFGVEARSLFYIHNREWLILIFPALLLVLPYIARRELLRQLSNPRVPIQGGGAVRRAQEVAHPVVRDYVLERARALGMEDRIEVVRKPNSAGETNACVWSAGGVEFMSMTSKAEVLLGMGRRGDSLRLEEFKFLVDHELGHIWHRDTAALLLARSILWCTLIRASRR
jgi:predicted metallopeptidase